MKAIFLDRDGVINKYPGDKKYVINRSGFHFLPKSKSAIARLSKAGFLIFVISNQAGVGRGIFTEETLDSITKKMLEGIGRSGGRVYGVYYCTHRKAERCLCRKPKAGLIDIVRKEYPVKPEESFFIGDSIRDVKTARACGCRSILVLSGKEKISNRKNWRPKPDFIFPDLSCAAEFILNRK